MKYLQLEPTHPPRKAHSERGRIFVSFGAQLDVKARFCYALVVNLLGLKVNCTVVSCGSVVPELDLGFGLSHAMRLVVRMGFLLPVLLMLMNRTLQLFLNSSFYALHIQLILVLFPKRSLQGCRLRITYFRRRRIQFAALFQILYPLIP
ncbi:uncharacterized protein [Physcomitrium patens]|uniref:uncharacterized protein isoform X1 n=1 Tax=Physcomitrium patens TaxID=3218 RepID=UPI003CCE1E9C